MFICTSYRPEYGNLVSLNAELPDVPLMVLTANPYIKQEVQQNPVMEVFSVNRPNITFHAVDLPKLLKKMVCIYILKHAFRFMNFI